MNLQQTLSENLQQGHKACVHLHRLVRKLTSVGAFIQMKKNEEKKQLDVYIDQISERLLEFRSEMLAQLEAGQKEKLQLIEEMKREYEAEIDTYNNLFDEAEKYTQFDKQIRSPNEKKSIKKVLEALRVLLEDLPDDSEMVDLLHLQFKPSLVVDALSTSYFGHLETSISPRSDDPMAETSQESQKQSVELYKDAPTTTDSKLEVGTDTGDHVPTPSKSSEVASWQSGSSVNESTQTDFLPLLDDKLQGKVLNDIINLNFQQIHTLNEEINIQRSLLPCLSSTPAGVASTCSNDSAVNMSCDINSTQGTIPSPTPALSLTSYLDQNIVNTKLRLDDKLCEETVSGSVNTDTEANGASPDRSTTTAAIVSGAGKPNTMPVVEDACDDVSKDLDMSVEYLWEEKAEDKCIIVDVNDVSSPVGKQSPVDVAVSTDKDCYIVEDQKVVIDLVESAGCYTSDTSRQTSSGTEEDNIKSSPTHSMESALKKRKALLPLKPLRRPLRLPKLVSKPNSPYKKGEEKSNDGSTSVDLGNERNGIENIGDGIEPMGTSTKLTAGVNTEDNTNTSYSLSENKFETNGMNNSNADTDECLGKLHDEDRALADADTKTEMEEKAKLAANDECTLNINIGKQDLPKHTLNTHIDDIKEETDSQAREDINNKRNIKLDPHCTTTEHDARDTVEVTVDINSEHTEDSKEADMANEKIAETGATSAGNTETVLHKDMATSPHTRHLSSGFTRLTSSSIRLGALQAHWLQNPGTDLKATYLFSFDEGLHFPIEVTMDKQDNIVVADTGNHLVKVFTSTGELLKVIGNDLDHRLKRPSAVVFNSNNDMFVKDDVCVHRFSSDGKFLAQLGKDTLVWPYGLDMTPVGNLITLDTNPRKPALVHLSQNGDVNFSFVYSPLINAAVGTKCRFLVVSETYVLVSDLGLSRIYITNFEGVFLGWFGHFGVRPEEFSQPSGLSVDHFGNVVIGDSKNNRIKMYRQDGQFIGLIKPDEPIIRPSGLHLTKDNKLIVVNYLHHSVKVYQLC